MSDFAPAIDSTALPADIQGKINRAKALYDTSIPLLATLDTLKLAAENAMTGVPPEYGPQAQWLKANNYLSDADLRLYDDNFTPEQRGAVIVAKMAEVQAELREEAYREIAIATSEGGVFQRNRGEGATKTLIRLGLPQDVAEFIASLRDKRSALWSGEFAYLFSMAKPSSYVFPNDESLETEFDSLTEEELRSILGYIIETDPTGSFGTPLPRDDFDQQVTQDTYDQIDDITLLRDTPAAIKAAVEAYNVCVTNNISPQKLKTDLSYLEHIIKNLPDHVAGVSIEFAKQTLAAFQASALAQVDALNIAYTLAEDIVNGTKPIAQQYSDQLLEMYETERAALPRHLRKELSIEDVDLSDFTALREAVENIILLNPNYDDMWDYNSYSKHIEPRLAEVDRLSNPPNTTNLVQINPLVEMAFFFAIDLFSSIGEIVDIGSALLQGDVEGAIQAALFAVLPFDDIARATEHYVNRSIEIATTYKRLLANSSSADEFIDNLNNLKRRIGDELGELRKDAKRYTIGTGGESPIEHSYISFEPTDIIKPQEQNRSCVAACVRYALEKQNIYAPEADIVKLLDVKPTTTGWVFDNDNQHFLDKLKNTYDSTSVRVGWAPERGETDPAFISFLFDDFDTAIVSMKNTNRKTEHHAIILHSVNKNSATIEVLDPAGGVLATMSWEQFFASWNKIFIVFRRNK